MTRDEKNNFIRGKFKAWQIEWHRLFDEDKTLIGTEYAPDGSKIPKDIYSDFRLICGISHVSPDTRKACFNLFPKGAEMAERCERFLSGKSNPISAEGAREITVQIAEIIDAAIPDEIVDWSNIVINERFGEENDLGGADRISYLFEGEPPGAPDDDAVLALAAGLFLTEPLYMSAGNWYEPGDWITGALLSPARDKVYELTYKLWDGGWYLGVAKAGVSLTQFEAV